jgi:hypothetical protein
MKVESMGITNYRTSTHSTISLNPVFRGCSFASQAACQPWREMEKVETSTTRTNAIVKGPRIRREIFTRNGLLIELPSQPQTKGPEVESAR